MVDSEVVEDSHTVIVKPGDGGHSPVAGAEWVEGKGVKRCCLQAEAAGVLLCVCDSVEQWFTSPAEELGE